MVGSKQRSAGASGDMRHVVRRRTLLASALAGAVTWALPPPVPAQRSVAILPQALADGLTLLRGAGANVVAFPTAAGLILVDGGVPELADALLETAYELAAADRIAALFNTNWRPEHTGANEMLGAAGTRIVAHQNTRLWMTNDFTVAWEKQRYLPRPVHALPNDPFYAPGSIELDDERIEYGHLPQAHTDGDIYVFFRHANVLVVSDLLAVASYPVIDYSTGGWIGGLLRATESLLALADDDTVIVPAMGPPQTRGALEAQLELCVTIHAAVGQAYANAHSLAEFIASNPAQRYRGERGDPDLFLELAYRSAWGHVRALGVGVV